MKSTESKLEFIAGKGGLSKNEASSRRERLSDFLRAYDHKLRELDLNPSEFEDRQLIMKLVNAYLDDHNITADEALKVNLHGAELLKLIQLFFEEHPPHPSGSAAALEELPIQKNRRATA